MHWGNVLKLAVVGGVVLGLSFLKLPVPQTLIDMAGVLVAGVLPSVVKGWAP